METSRNEIYIRTIEYEVNNDFLKSLTLNCPIIDKPCTCILAAFRKLFLF